MSPEEVHRQTPDRITKVIRSWGRKAVVLRWLHTGLVVIAVVTSISASAGVALGFFDGSGFLSNVQSPLSVVAAIAIGLVSTFDLGTKANNFRNAHRVLRAAIMRYEEEAGYNVEDLIKAYESGERLIGDVNTTSTT